eukprot:245420-Chlamydomonas_euryale.AAC.1
MLWALAVLSPAVRPDASVAKADERALHGQRWRQEPPVVKQLAEVLAPGAADAEVAGAAAAADLLRAAGGEAAAAHGVADAPPPLPRVSEELAALDGAAARLVAKMQSFWDDAPGASLAGAAAAMARLRLRPNAWWVKGFVESSARALRGMRPCELSAVAWALASMELWPGVAWGRAWGRAVGARAPSFAPLALANALWAASALRLPLPDGAFDALCERALQLMADGVAATVGDGVGGGGGGSGALQRMVDGGAAAAGNGDGGCCGLAAFEPHQAASMLVALVRLHRGGAHGNAGAATALVPAVAGGDADAAPAPDRLVIALVESLRGRLSAVSTGGLAGLSWALARRGFVPDTGWTRELLSSAASPQRPPLTGAQLCQLAWALARWDCRPGATWARM